MTIQTKLKIQQCSCSMDKECPLHPEGKTPCICNPSSCVECPIHPDDNGPHDPSDTPLPKQVTDSVDHRLLNWTFCYNDSCVSHLSEKEHSGWFPKEPREKRQLAMGRHGPLYNTAMNDSDSDCSSTMDRYPAEETQQTYDYLEEANLYPERFLGRYIPIAPDTTITRIAIAGNTLDEAYQELNQLPAPQEIGDEPKLWPRHPQHSQLSWAACIQHCCRYHFAQKAAYNLFPRRFGAGPITQTYEYYELENWQITQRNLTQGYVIMELKPGYSLRCLIHKHDWQRCIDPECRVHQADKATDWHRQQASSTLQVIRPAQGKGNDRL